MPIRTHLCGRSECGIRCPVKNKYCSDNCHALVRASRIPAKVAERIRLEDRFLATATAYLAKHPAKTARLAPPRKNRAKTSTPHEMVLMVSDAHYSEIVDPEIAMGIQYNEGISQRRLERMRDVTLRYKQLRETSYPIQKLTCAVLGDMLSGDIHEELEITNESPLPVALVKLAYLLHDMFSAFAREFPKVEVVIIPGNHPRTKKVPRNKQKTVTNFEYILGHFVAALAQGAYTVQVPKDLVYVHKVFEWRLGMSHGDAVKSNSFAGIPFYGLRQRREALQALFRHLGQPQLDYLMLGHFHQPTVLEGTDSTVIINGSIKGGDEYSLNNYLSSNDPVQYLLTFHERHGLTDYSRINLKEVK